jgi:repressor LexA
MLTQRQREVYEFVVSYVDAHGYPPTVREIGEAVGLASPSTVHAHLANLVGEIAAGGPLLAEENVEDHLAVPDTLSRGGEEFLLRVKGESMVEAGILDGDYVVVQRQQTARDGDIVVALAGQDEAADEATVKRFFREKGRVRLQPENSTMQSLYPDHISVLGKVVGVFRRVG